MSGDCTAEPVRDNAKCSKSSNFKLQNKTDEIHVDMYKLTDAVPRPRPIRGLAGRGSAVAQQLSIPYATGAASMHSHSLCSKHRVAGAESSRL